MEKTTMFTRLIQDPEFSKLLAGERIVLDASEKIISIMQEEHVSKQELGRRLWPNSATDNSNNFITEMFSGRKEYKLAMLAQVFHVLGYELQLNPVKMEVPENDIQSI